MYTCTILQIFVRGILTIFIFPNKPFQQTSNKIFLITEISVHHSKRKKKQPKIIHTELAGILISVYSNNVKLSQLILEITFAYNSLASQKYHSHIKSFI